MLMLLLFLWQEPEIEPESVNARVFLDSGEVVELTDFRLKGIEPHAFEFRDKDEQYFLSIFRIAQVRRLDRRGNFEILLDSGEKKTGKITAVNIIGAGIKKEDKKRVVTGDIEAVDDTDQVMIMLSRVQRIHFISGFQLRACVDGHYEQYTPYPFCPVCGKELQIGPHREDPPEVSPTLPPFYRLRLDPRNPSSRRN
ncbi:MAG: hypothetical protein QNK37_00645 [Acidobacteriota bacterium]|nr:hypothetical protein [Acidobacteriota bacterium]